VILRLAVLIQYRSVSDTHTHTDRQTDTRRRHIPRLARRRAVMKLVSDKTKMHKFETNETSRFKANLALI